MSRYKIIISIFAFIVTMFSCQQREMMDYEGADGVWFCIQPPTNTGFGDPDTWPAVDTSQMAFIKMDNSVNDTVVSIPVRVMGNIKDYDREFGVRVAATSTVIEGEDYENVLSYYTVPAGSDRGYVTVKFNRTDRMLTDEFYLTLELVATADFTVPFPKRIIPPLGQHGPEDSVYVNKHTLIVSNLLYTPQAWNDYVGGPFTAKKLELLEDLYDVTFAQLDDPDQMNYSILRPMLKGVKYYLMEQEAAGTPVYEEDVFGEILYYTDEEGEFILDDDGEKIPVPVTLGNI